MIQVYNFTQFGLIHQFPNLNPPQPRGATVPRTLAAFPRCTAREIIIGTERMLIASCQSYPGSFFQGSSLSEQRVLGPIHQRF